MVLRRIIPANPPSGSLLVEIPKYNSPVASGHDLVLEHVPVLAPQPASILALKKEGMLPMIVGSKLQSI